MNFQVVEMQHILKMCKNVFHICQTDLTSVNRDILRHGVSNESSNMSGYLVTRLEMLCCLPKTALDCKSETLVYSSGSSLTSCESFVFPGLKMREIWGHLAGPVGRACDS